jgi:hypothetical protein
LRLLENRALRRIFGSKREVAVEGWTIIRVMKSRRMRRAGHVERMGEMRNAHRILG